MAPCIRHLERLGIESLSRRIMARFDRRLRDLEARLTDRNGFGFRWNSATL
jgi:hypothetical protein